jgi:hypothetical protein
MLGRASQVLSIAFLGCVTLGACLGDDPDRVVTAPDATAPTPDASKEGSTSTMTDGAVDARADVTPKLDAGADADADSGPVCQATPQACTATMQTCVNNCRVTYNICKTNCPQDGNLMNCINTCKATLASCQNPCKSDCVTCANQNGSCTGNPDCSAIIYVDN